MSDTKRMPTLSIRQPWAWLIVNGYKDVENRDWITPYRGRVLIHAGKAMTRKYYEQIREDLAHNFPGIDLPTFEDLPRGGIVGVASIVDCATSIDSPWFGGPYGFVLREARVLPFFAVNGKLGFFDVEIPSSLLEGVR